MVLQKYNDLCAAILNLQKLYCVLNLMGIFFSVSTILKIHYVLKFTLVAVGLCGLQGWATEVILQWHRSLRSVRAFLWGIYTGEGLVGLRNASS